ncbi:MAG: MFS transporter [Actinobacteria bacterium]|nr:MAG: MFS transporter [Actinomycetota bacterium]
MPAKRRQSGAVLRSERYLRALLLPRALRPLRHRRYALLWTGAFVSNIGTWMETVAVGILVTKATGQAQWAGMVAAAAFVPTALLAPVGGALADRLPRRRLLLATTTLQTIFAGTLCALAAVNAARPAAVTLIVLFAGCAQALGFPSYQAMIPDLVGREDLAGAVALGSAQWNLGRVIGPALAGIVISVGGYEWAFAVNTASFLAVLAAIAPLELPSPRPVPGQSVAAAIRDGIRYIVREPGLRALLSYLALNSLFAAPFIALIPAVALKLFHDERGGTAALVTAQGIGAVAMALVLGILTERFGHRRVLLGCVGTLPIVLGLYALAPTLSLGVVAIFFVGFAYLGCLSSFTTIAQLLAPPELRGRVVSAQFVLLGAVYPIGSIAQGAIADEIGLRATTAGAAILLGASVIVIRILRPRFDRTLSHVDVSTTPAAATR